MWNIFLNVIGGLLLLIIGYVIIVGTINLIAGRYFEFDCNKYGKLKIKKKDIIRHAKGLSFRGIGKKVMVDGKKINVHTFYFCANNREYTIGYISENKRNDVYYQFCKIMNSPILNKLIDKKKNDVVW